MRLTRSQKKFLENLKGWECKFEKQKDETYFFRFHCQNHQGHLDITTEEFEDVKSFKELSLRITRVAKGYDPYKELPYEFYYDPKLWESMKDFFNEFKALKRELVDLAFQFSQYR